MAKINPIMIIDEKQSVLGTDKKSATIYCMTSKILIPLTSVRIKSDDAAYKSVEELSEVLERAKEYGIKNENSYQNHNVW